MTKFFNSGALPIGLAMFSMFFGAGNVIFPLAVGSFAGDKNLYAMAGLIITAAIMPILGVIAMILFEGNYKTFFGRLGKWPGFLLALLIISLLGPLGSTPRCIALSYTTLKSSFLDISPVLFSALACGVIYLFTFRQNHILSLLGLFLTPLLLTALIIIIVLGLMKTPDLTLNTSSNHLLFLHGLKEGYNTMDLLAAFFFSSTILNLLKIKLKEEEKKEHLKTAFWASLVGAFLLAAVYVGFSYLAAFHGKELQISGKDQLLSALTMRIAGPYAGILVCFTIALACLTTAIALISAFSDFIKKEVFKDKISYQMTLFLSLLLTFFISTFEFTGISAFLGPILEISYPGLIVLTLLNIAHRLRDFRPIKIPVFVAFAIAALYYVGNL
jgi:LIVCS family branched-chain amino acid:cation transporter